MPSFLITEVSAEKTDRVLHPTPREIAAEKQWASRPHLPQYEEIKITINLVGHGDTTKIETTAILAVIMERLKEIDLTHSESGQ